LLAGFDAGVLEEQFKIPDKLKETPIEQAHYSAAHLKKFSLLPHGTGHRPGTMARKYGFSFSWKRAIGLSAAKGKLSRKIGIPLTRSGRQRKAGKAMGCCVTLAALSCGGMTMGILVKMLSN
jgi:hypothetical protein